MPELTLYTNPMSRGRVARWMLEETGADYGVETVAFDALKAPAYLAINPMGKVPAIRHGRTVVTENAAICAYLADAFPEAGLAPPVSERGAYYRWLFFGAGPFEAAVSDRRLGVEVTPETRRWIGYGTFEDCVETMAARLEESPYLAGETFTAADVAAGSQVIYGLKFKSIPARPAFEDYVARVTDRPAAQRAEALDDADMPARHGA